jgi:hypothetical protein
MHYIFLLVVIVLIAVGYYIFRKTPEPFNDSFLFEGCVRYPQFSLSKTTGGSPGMTGGSSNPQPSLTNLIMDAQLFILESIKKKIAEIKTKIPINFVLGRIQMKDPTEAKVPDVKLDVSLPSIRLNFTMPFPELGPTGARGPDGDPKIGPTGPTGPTGSAGESGYWGTLKDTLY